MIGSDCRMNVKTLIISFSRAALKPPFLIGIHHQCGNLITVEQRISSVSRILIMISQVQ